NRRISIRTNAAFAGAVARTVTCVQPVVPVTPPESYVLPRYVPEASQKLSETFACPSVIVCSQADSWYVRPGTARIAVVFDSQRVSVPGAADDTIFSACVGECERSPAQLNVAGPTLKYDDSGFSSKSPSGARLPAGGVVPTASVGTESAATVGAKPLP